MKRTPRSFTRAWCRSSRSMCGSTLITSTIAMSDLGSRPASCRTSSTGTSLRETLMAKASSAPTRKARAQDPPSLLLEPVTRPEHPGDHCHAAGNDRDRDGDARPQRHVRDRIEAPPKAADDVDDRVEERNRSERLVQ